MEWEVLFDDDFRTWFDAAEEGLRMGTWHPSRY